MAEGVVLYSGSIVSRKDARKAKLSRYFTGKPCRHGHIAERQSFGSACCECVRIRVVRSPYDYVKAWRQKNPGARKEEARNYRKRHPDKLAANRKRWRERHIETLRPLEAEQARKRRARDPEGERRRYIAHKARREEGLATIAGRPRPELCEVCFENNGGIVFDHCHASGDFRGWICDRCNKTLGMVKDNPALMRNLAEYLERSRGEVDTGGD